MDDEIKIRPVRAEIDIFQVPDLILECFRPWMDPDARAYIGEMQADAEWQKHHPLWSRLRGQLYPMRGFVAETADGRIVGNLSIFEGENENRHCLQFANICVAADCRGKGIGHRLVRRALEDCEGERVLLRVREQTPDAIRLYSDCGFRIIGRQSDWIYPAGRRVDTWHESEIVIPRESGKQLFTRALDRVFPPEVRMFMPADPGCFRFGFWGNLRNLLLNGNIRFRSVYLKGRPVGWFLLTESEAYVNSLCFVPALDASEDDLSDALAGIAAAYTFDKGLLCETTVSTPAFLRAGFVRHQSLIIMRR